MNFKLVDEKQLKGFFSVDITGTPLNFCGSSLASLRSPSWPLQLLSNIDKNGIARIRSIFTSNLLHCIGSFAKGDYNCLLFSDKDLGEKLVLVQHCCNTVIASLDKFIFTPLSDVDHWVDLSVRLIEQSLEEIGTAFDESNGYPASLGGLNLSQGRPYHYFYDYLYGLDLILSEYRHGLLPIYAVIGRGFINPSLIFMQTSYLELSEADINKMNKSRKTYLVSPCIQHCRDKSDPDLSSISRKLGDLARAAYLDCADQITGKPILWIGVSTEKRSWVEQIDGYAAMVNLLSQEFPDLQVFVDGRTFPISPSAADWAVKAKEDDIFLTISRKCSGVNLINLIGADSLKKLAFCSSISAFVAHIATDSMFPSALCRKPGVIYSSNCMGKWGARLLHLHHNVVEVDSSEISDVLIEGAAADWATTSVSMKWQSIYRLLAPILRQSL